MKQPLRSLIAFNDLTRTRKIIAVIALFLSVIPALLIIGAIFFIDGLASQFVIMIILLLYNISIFVVSMLVYLIADSNIKRKLIYLVTIIILHVSIFPILWQTNKVDFVFEYQSELETISNNILDNKWTWDYAEKYMATKKIPIMLFSRDTKHPTVLFVISGFLDNRHGVAYSRTGQKSMMVTWKHLRGNWYEWSIQ